MMAMPVFRSILLVALGVAVLAPASPALANEISVSVTRTEADGKSYTLAYVDVKNPTSEKIDRILIRCQFFDPSEAHLDYSSTIVHELESEATRQVYVAGWTKQRFGRVECHAE